MAEPETPCLQVKDKYANSKPYGDWLKAQVSTLPDLIESVPEHILKVLPIHSSHITADGTFISSSQDEGQNGSDTLSSSSEGSLVGVGASNGQSNGRTGRVCAETPAVFAWCLALGWLYR